MKRVAVTGASGFVGRAAVTALKNAGHHVIALSSRAGKVEGANETVTANLLTGEGVEQALHSARADCLLHLAWYVEHGKFWHARENLDWLAASLQLYRQFAATGGKRVVTAGTCAEYDWTAANTAAPLVEDNAATHPHTLYGTAKLALCNTIRQAARLDEISHAHGRLFFLYGADESPSRLVRGAMETLRRGEGFDSTSGTQIRDFMHVDDVGRAFAALCDSDTSGPVNIASGETTTLADLLQIIATLTNGHHLLNLGARPQQPGEPANLLADTTKLRTEAGFTPDWKLKDGLAQMLDALGSPG